MNDELFLPCLTFRLDYRVKVLDSLRVVLLSEDSSHLLTGKLYVSIAQLLTLKKLSKNSLLTHLSKQYSLDEIEYAIARLIEKKHLVYSNGALPICQEAFWHSQNILCDGYHESLKVSLINFSANVSSDLAMKIFIDVGINTILDQERADLDVYIVDNYLHPTLELVNNKMLASKRPWMIVKPEGSIMWVGPIFTSHSNYCWKCLSHSLKENKRVEIDIYGCDSESLNLKDNAAMPTIRNIALNLAANEALKWFYSKSSQLEHAILTFDVRSMASQFHRVCPYFECSCNQRPEVRKHEILLISSKKNYVKDEVERACSPQATLQKLENLISPITGLLPKLKYLNSNNTHVYYSASNLPVYEKNNPEYKLRVPDVVVGKSRDSDQAKVSCLAEAVERYNCSYHNQYQVRATYEEMAEKAIHPYKLLNFSPNQYLQRDQINLTHGPFNQVPKKFCERSNIGWTPLYSLIHKNVRYIPSSYCYLNYPMRVEREMCPSDSNGCASGNSIEEAINYAILELIERDAFAIWWYNRIQRPAVNLSTFEEFDFSALQKEFSIAGREFFVLDITSDLLVPSFAAISWNKSGERIFIGSGSHLDPCKGILRAIYELHQAMTRDTIPKNSKVQNFAEVEQEFIRWILQEKIEHHSYLTPSKMLISKKDYINSNSDDFKIDTTCFLDIFKKLESDVLVLNMSRAKMSFFSVKVIIPGLRHFWNRRALGRLYDVPVSLGWINSPRQESQMNPISYFL